MAVVEVVQALALVVILVGMVLSLPLGVAMITGGVLVLGAALWVEADVRAGR